MKRALSAAVALSAIPVLVSATPASALSNSNACTVGNYRGAGEVVYTQNSSVNHLGTFNYRLSPADASRRQNNVRWQVYLNNSSSGPSSSTSSAVRDGNVHTLSVIDQVYSRSNLVTWTFIFDQFGPDPSCSTNFTI